MEGRFIMSAKEANRISIMDKLVKKEIKQKDAARILSISVRQARRVQERYRREGAAGLIHGNRGRVGTRRIPPEEISRVMEIVKNRYWDFGPTLALEKLKEHHQVTFGRERLRKAMIRAGVWESKRRKKPRIHQMRERRPCEGELVQTDGSPHAWFEDRRPECVLLGCIDDATGKVKWLEFFESETTLAYFQATKGRIEKLFETLQDRLVKEMRLKGINTIREANQYLPEFIVKFNQKFSVKPRSPVNVHRPLLSADNLERILAFHHTRILSRNLACQFDNKLYRVKTKRPACTMRHAPVLTVKDLKGIVTIEYQGRKLDYAILEKQPRAEIIDTKQSNRIINQIKVDKTQVIKTPWKPPEEHPWRYFTI